jgi:hypothetical protein
MIALVELEKAKQDFSLPCNSFAVDGKQFLTENHVNTPAKNKQQEKNSGSRTNGEVESYIIAVMYK